MRTPSPEDSPLERTALVLARLRQGDSAAQGELFALVYGDLRDLASNYMRRERGGHTLQTTALVHEAYLKFASKGGAWEDRAHFVGVAARAIRQILVDHARERNALKRGGDRQRLSLSDSDAVVGGDDLDAERLDEALERFAKLDERPARVVELRFFGGPSVAEAAHVLGVSERTVKGDWQIARAWLRRELSGPGSEP